MTKNYCHLSLKDREKIEECLNEELSINIISKLLKVNHSTIIREVERNKVYCKPKNFSLHYSMADFKDHYKYDHCIKLDKSPHVCNGCKSRSGCRKERFTYYARKANDSYKEVMSESRKGINLSEEEVFNIDNTITPLIMKGQTVNHVYINHPEVLNISKTSFYNYTSLGLFKFKPSNLPRMVKYKKRKNNKRRTRQEREIRIGRTYEDFIDYTSKDTNLNIVEMDTVEGLKSDSKCMLTLLWRKYNFMFIFLLESQTTNEVTKVFEYLQETLSVEDYKRLFQVILTDNGTEFFDVLNIECNHKTAEQVTKVFYCDPSASWQKASIEKNHEFIRYVLPKKTSFKDLTKDKCFILSNHINSLCRKELNNQCPFKAMLFTCDESILNKLNSYYIKPDEVILNKSLLK